MLWDFLGSFKNFGGKIKMGNALDPLFPSGSTPVGDIASLYTCMYLMPPYVLSVKCNLQWFMSWLTPGAVLTDSPEEGTSSKLIVWTLYVIHVRVHVQRSSCPVNLELITIHVHMMSFPLNFPYSSTGERFGHFHSTRTLQYCSNTLMKVAHVNFHKV